MPKSIADVLQTSRDALEALWDCTCLEHVKCERCINLSDLDALLLIEELLKGEFDE